MLDYDFCDEFFIFSSTRGSITRVIGQASIINAERNM